jgi:serine/threonine-protein kinase
MGEVWRAHDTDTDRIVAIKVLPAHFSENEDFQRRFRREAHAAARLNSPHVIPIHYYGEIDGRLYVDMRLIEGRDLQTVLTDGPLEPSRAVRIIEQVAKALHAAHKVGLVHRDVKPSNILLDEDDFAYLIDFGIARAAADTRLTSTGSMIGTLLYMAPERLGTSKEDARADIYALACVLYECLTGSPPFAEESVERLMMAHLNTPPPQPSTTQPNVPEQIDQVIATGMAKDPDNRYATTVELADAARDAITVPIPRPTPTVPPEPPRAASVPTAPPPIPAEDQTPSPTQPPTEPAAVTSAPPTIPAPHRTPPPGNIYASTPTERRPPVEVPTHRREPSAEQPPQPAPPAQPREAQPLFYRLSRRGKVALIAGAIAVAAAIATTLIVAGHQSSPTSQPSVSSSALPPSPPSPPWLELPFTGLKTPRGVAVDTAGSVYVADHLNNRVLKLAAGSTTPTELPFTGLYDPDGVAVDTAGNVYVAALGDIFKLTVASATPTRLPFTDVLGPEGMAVDTAGNVYVADTDHNRVLKLTGGSTSPTELPFTRLNSPRGVAVDTAGNVYVSDAYNGRVLKLAAGSTTPTELPGMSQTLPEGVAVDATGNVYVTDFGNKVLKLALGAASPTELPSTELKHPKGVAVDTAGNVYVVDSDNNRVLKLPAH